ncbi:Os02g0826016 [Oryza sativa Japonica Group]|uniref:Os02g0826016 protein n=1 Tax=Oryza sativa subsp. japonica TaxID=39947 RepID=A0A0P0VRT2_ORYSJ|nr:hypothetical protein EE612_014594 [Oryza sativa]BAS81688.1 Os02g0826016 [Oryza sativa Japonica Group]
MLCPLTSQNTEFSAVEVVAVGGHCSGNSFANGETIIVLEVEAYGELAKGNLLVSEIEDVVCCIRHSSVHLNLNCVLGGGIITIIMGHKGINRNV